ncbi:uncharacterized protein LOC123306415 [Coccinella septempunctata]|uniref:uncharacterized protein LOC123306415 n=1 Tax=Coccinella septempunctata TaxID=41139 RepID=UPI001D05E38B|nr:uncharacterized protein LOC123306415 [Coccinella septempunctata]
MDIKERVLYRKIEESGIRVQADFGIKCLSLVIFQETNEEFLIFKSMILEQNLKHQADKLGLSEDDYFEKLISLFENPCRVKFNLCNNNLTVIEDVNSHLQVKYFTCNINKASSSSIGSFIDDLQSQKAHSDKQCKKLLYDNDCLKRDVDEYKKKLEELVDRKIIDEQMMLRNFVLLLNEKKKRIQHLSELLEAYRNDPSLAEPVEVNINCNKKRKTKNTTSREPQCQIEENISDSGSGDSNHAFEIDKEHLADGIKAESTSSKHDDIFEESSSDQDLSLMKFPNPNSLKNFSDMLASTSKEITPNSELKSNENDKPSLSASLDFQMDNIDTQEYIDNL